MYNPANNQSVSFIFYAVDSHVFPSIASLTVFDCIGTEGVRVVFPLSLQPGENVSLAFWSGIFAGKTLMIICGLVCCLTHNHPSQKDDPIGAQIEAQQFVNRLALPSDQILLAENTTLANWPFPYSPTPSVSLSATISSTPIPSISVTPSSSFIQQPTPTPTRTPSSSRPPRLRLVTERDFRYNATVRKSSTRITKQLFKDGFDVLLVEENSGTVYGTVHIPSELIPIDWYLIISVVNETDWEKPKPELKNVCGDNSDFETAVAIQFKMVVLDSNKDLRSLQELFDHRGQGKDGITITLVYSMTRSQRQDDCDSKDLVFIFLEEGGDSWQLSQDKVEATGTVFGNVSVTVKHLTSKPHSFH